MRFFYTTKKFVSDDGQSISVSAVIEISGDKHFILKAKWTTGPKKYIEYWFRARKVKLTQQQQETLLAPFVIKESELRLE